MAPIQIQNIVHIRGGLIIAIRIVSKRNVRDEAIHHHEELRERGWCISTKLSMKGCCRRGRLLVVVSHELVCDVSEINTSGNSNPRFCLGRSKIDDIGHPPPNDDVLPMLV